MGLTHVFIKRKLEQELGLRLDALFTPTNFPETFGELLAELIRLSTADNSVGSYQVKRLSDDAIWKTLCRIVDFAVTPSRVTIEPDTRTADVLTF